MSGATENVLSLSFYEAQVSGHIDTNITDYDKELSTDQIRQIGWQTSSVIGSVYTSIMSYAWWSDSYIPVGQDAILTRNFAHLKTKLLENSLPPEATEDKISKVSKKVEAQLTAIKQKGLILNNQIMTFDYHRDMMEAECLRFNLSQKKLPWLEKMGFSSEQLEGAPLSLLQQIEALRKAKKGEAFGHWLLNQNPVKAEPLEDSINAFTEHLIEKMGQPFKLKCTTLETFNLSERASQLKKSFSCMGIEKAYLLYATKSLDEGTAPIDFLKNLETFQEALEQAFLRYRNLENYSQDSVEALFKAYLQGLKNLFALDPDEIQHLFNIQQRSLLCDKYPSLESLTGDISQKTFQEKMHFLEFESGLALNLLDQLQIQKGPFAQLAKDVEKLKSHEILSLLLPFFEQKKLFDEFAVGSIFMSAAQKYLSNNPRIPSEKKISEFVPLCEETAKNFAQLKAMANDLFSLQEDLKEMFLKTAVLTIRNSQERKDTVTALKNVTQNICGRFTSSFESKTVEEAGEIIIALFAEQLNNITATPRPFDSDFIKEYLLEKQDEPSNKLAELEAWASFSKGKPSKDIRSFILNFNQLPFSHCIATEEKETGLGQVVSKFFTGLKDRASKESVTTPATSKQTLQQTLSKLYEAYSAYSEDGESANLFETLLQSKVFKSIPKELSPEELKAHISALGDAIAISKAISERRNYDSDLLIEALKRNMNLSENLLSFATFLKTQEGQTLIHRTYVELKAAQEALSPLQRVTDAISHTQQSFYEVAITHPERLLTILLPAFMGALTKNPSSARELEKQLTRLEDRTHNLEFVKSFEPLLKSNRNLLRIIAVMPPTEVGGLVREIVESLTLLAENKKQGLEPDYIPSLFGILGREILKFAVEAAVEKFSMARDTNVHKLDFPTLQQFHDDFPDTSAFTNTWSYKLASRAGSSILMRLAPSVMPLAFWCVGNARVLPSLSAFVKENAPGMDSRNQEALINGLNSIIQMLSTQGSSILADHQIPPYVDFLGKAHAFLHKETATTKEEASDFTKEVWEIIHRLLIDLKDLPEALEEVFKKISAVERAYRARESLAEDSFVVL